MATIVEGNPKAPFSIATTPRCRGGRYSFPGLLYFTLDPYLIMLSVKQGGIKYHFWVFGMTRPGIERRSPGPLANTLTPRPSVTKMKTSFLNFFLDNSISFFLLFLIYWIFQKFSVVFFFFGHLSYNYLKSKNNVST